MSIFGIVAVILVELGCGFRKFQAHRDILEEKPHRNSKKRRPSINAFAKNKLPSLASTGCFHEASSSSFRSWNGWMGVNVEDFEPVKRKFWLHVTRRLLPRYPRALKRGDVGVRDETPAPLVIALHGQGGDADWFAHAHKYRELGRRFGFISAYPQGMRDVNADGPDDQGTGWNDGSSGDDSICTKDISSSQTGCYNSCMKLQRCGRCNWSTCYDDAAFIKAMIAKISKMYCVDLARIYLQGESNGAQLLYHLIRRLPGTFAAVSPWYGQPLLHYGFSKADIENSGPLLKETGILQLHLRHDVTIPLKGGTSEDKWIFEPFATELDKLAKIHSCNRNSSGVSTSWDGGSLNFVCQEFPGCRTGRRIAWCLYDGEHGTWPEDDGGSGISVWFFRQHARKSFSLDIQPLRNGR